MSLWDFLQTPAGLQLTNALCVLIVAIAGYVTFLTHRQTQATAAKLTDHVNATAKILGEEPDVIQDVVASQTPSAFRKM